MPQVSINFINLNLLTHNMENFFYWLNEEPVVDEVDLPEVVDPECFLIDKMISMKIKALIFCGLIEADPDLIDYYNTFNS